ncbi:MAG: dephospho-CoA kinase [Firmicutes bacterium]|nr:dephospho-CoA kinase [Bacillota bacterium]
MEIIGLTGGIGTGKSTVSRYLSEQNFAIVDADLISRQVVEPGMPLLDELEAAFGSDIINEDGSLNRKGLAAIVFNDVEKRKLMDSIMHKEILAEMRRVMEDFQQQGTHQGIIIDAPLLFEIGLEKWCGQVWLVTADMDLRIERVCARDDAKPEEVEARIRNQMSDDEKKKLSDEILDNSGTLEELHKQISELLQKKGFEVC